MAMMTQTYRIKVLVCESVMIIVFCCILREDYLRASRALLREIVRALRHDMDFIALCRGFMKERTESQFRDLEAPIKVCKCY